MPQIAHAKTFTSLHEDGKLLVLYNAWDAGSARAIAQSGAPAVATSSWAVAAAQGFEDGEKLGFERLLTIIERIAATIEVPLSVDFESGYAHASSELARNAERLIALGVAGLNFEDGDLNSGGLIPAAEQVKRVEAIRSVADGHGVPLFINARTDLFLQAPAERHVDLVSEAIERAAAYEAAGASGIFVPGLVDNGLIAQICAAVRLPVNVMVGAPDAPLAALKALGVRRVSYGPAPYLEAMAKLEGQARTQRLD